MSEKYTAPKHASCDCCGVSRREFMAAGAASAAALHAALATGVSSAEESTSPGKPLVQVAFARPDVKKYSGSWPGATYDITARAADYTKVMADAAEKFGMKLDVHPTPLANDAAAKAFAAKVEKAKPCGVIVILQQLHYAETLHQRCLDRLPDIPTIVFSPTGTSFHVVLPFMKDFSQQRKMYFASTYDYNWLAFGMRMLSTIWQMEQTRICVVPRLSDVVAKPKDIVLDTIGTTLHYISRSRVSEEYAKIKETDAVRALAASWEKDAQKVVEPTKQDIVNAAKTYVLCRRLMEQEGCQGIAGWDCLRLAGGKIALPCMAFLQLNGEGAPAACMADWPGVISLRLSYLLLGRPGFMNNMCSSSVNNTLIGAHCTSPIRLAGPDQPAVPYILRNHAESGTSVAAQVLWPVGEKITIMKFPHPRDQREDHMPSPNGALANRLRIGSGRVVCNIDTPPSGGCRTLVEVAVDGVEDIVKVKMLHHMLYVLGDHTPKFKAYCKLAGIQVESLIS